MDAPPLSPPPYSPNPRRYATRNKEARRITSDEWNQLIEVYRKWDGRISMVAAELGWPEAKTRRVYKRGYPSLGLPGIETTLARDALATEEIRAGRQAIQERLPKVTPLSSPQIAVQNPQVLARGEQKRIAVMVDAEERRVQARRDAVEARAEEAVLISITRRNAVALNGVTSKMLNGALALSTKIEQELKNLANDKSVSVEKKISLVKSAASIARFNAEASVLAVKAERMVTGQPIDTPDDESAVSTENSLIESERWINVAMKALNRAKERGVLTTDGETTKTEPTGR